MTTPTTLFIAASAALLFCLISAVIAGVASANFAKTNTKKDDQSLITVVFAIIAIVLFIFTIYFMFSGILGLAA